MLHFMQLAHPRHKLWIFMSKTQNTNVKTQKSPVSNTEHNTSVYKTQCHIQASVKERNIVFFSFAENLI